ncbi:unnamed protein product, partial [Prorocentrum cordatum]
MTGYTRGALERIFSGATHDTFKPVLEVRNIQGLADRTFISVSDGVHVVKTLLFDRGLVQQISMNALLRLTNYALQDMGNKTFLVVNAAETNLGFLPEHERVPAQSLQKLYHRVGGDCGPVGRLRPADAAVRRVCSAAPGPSPLRQRRDAGEANRRPAPQGVERTPEPLFDPGSARGFDRQAPAEACQAGAGPAAPQALRRPWEPVQQ